MDTQKLNINAELENNSTGITNIGITNFLKHMEKGGGVQNTSSKNNATSDPKLITCFLSFPGMKNLPTPDCPNLTGTEFSQGAVNSTLNRILSMCNSKSSKNSLKNNSSKNNNSSNQNSSNNNTIYQLEGKTPLFSDQQHNNNNTQHNNFSSSSQKQTSRGSQVQLGDSQNTQFNNSINNNTINNNTCSNNNKISLSGKSSKLNDSVHNTHQIDNLSSNIVSDVRQFFVLLKRLVIQNCR